jgi:hypothetical protein
MKGKYSRGLNGVAKKEAKRDIIFYLDSKARGPPRALAFNPSGELNLFRVGSNQGRRAAAPPLKKRAAQKKVLHHHKKCYTYVVG